MAGGKRKAGAAGASTGEAGGLRAARAMWAEAADGGNHAGVRAWLRGLGLPMDRFEAGPLPESLRFAPAVPYFLQKAGAEAEQLATGPAVLARVDDIAGAVGDVLRVYLDPGGPEPAGSELAGAHLVRDDGPAVKLVAGAAGGAIRLSSAFGHGVLCITEDLETGMALLAAGAPVGVWAAPGIHGLGSIEVPGGLTHEREGLFDLVVIAVSADHSGAGLAAASMLARRLMLQSPHLEVLIAVPTALHAPGLFAVDGSFPIEVRAISWIDVLKSAGAKVMIDGITDHRTLVKPEVVREPEARRPRPPKPSEGEEWELPRGDLERARVGLRAMFAPEEGERRWRLARWGGAWWVYKIRERCWKKVTDESLRAALHHFYGPMKTVAKGGKTMAFAPTARAIEGIRNCMATDTLVPGDSMPCWLAPTHDDEGEPEWGLASMLEGHEAETTIKPGSVLAYQNGLLDGDAWCERGELELLPHSPRWFSRSCLPYELPIDELRAASADDSDLDDLCRRLCPTWLGFLKTITEGLDEAQAAIWIRCLRQWFGYLLTHDNSLDAILAIIGPGRSGKGTILSMLEAVVGKEACAWTSLNDLAERFEMQNLVGKGVAIISDAHIGRKTDPVMATERAKTISGGDSVPVEAKYGEKTSFLPTCRLVICANELPKLPDPSGALASRLTVLTMTKSFAGSEDRTLKPRVLKEAAGVMVWALVGLKDLRQERKFVVTQDGADTLKEFALLNSPVMAYLQDGCIVQEGSSVVCKVMYRAYQLWAQESGHTPLAAERFGAQLKAVCPGMRKADVVRGGKRAWEYVGVRPLLQGEDPRKPAGPRHIDRIDDPEDDAPYLRP